jgi:hypothetical protein
MALGDLPASLGSAGVGGVGTGSISAGGSSGGAEKIAKALARSDLGVSRRDAERVVAEGRVAVNGERIASPALVRRAPMLRFGHTRVLCNSGTTLLYHMGKHGDSMEK